MPMTSFETMPDDARLWVFAADPPLHGDGASQLLTVADEFLTGWQAHGKPLQCARDWRESRFLAIAVDQRSEGASGCSIDGLFRALRSLEPRIGASLTAGGRVFYREPQGAVHAVGRDEFERLAEAGAVDQTTRVFDTSVTTAGDWRRHFERDAGDSWHASLLPASRR